LSHAASRYRQRAPSNAVNSVSVGKQEAVGIAHAQECCRPRVSLVCEAVRRACGYRLVEGKKTPQHALNETRVPPARHGSSLLRRF